MEWLVITPLSSRRLRLEPLSVVAAVEMVGVLDGPQLYEFTGGQAPSLAQLERQYAAQTVGGSVDGSQRWLNWLVRHGLSGHLVGYVQATVEDGTDGLEAELAWVMGVAFQEQGFATEAAAAMIEWLRRRGVRVTVAHIHPSHAASIAVARKVGMTCTGAWVGEELRWARRL